VSAGNGPPTRSVASGAARTARRPASPLSLLTIPFDRPHLTGPARYLLNRHHLDTFSRAEPARQRGGPSNIGVPPGSQGTNPCPAQTPPQENVAASARDPSGSPTVGWCSAPAAGKLAPPPAAPAGPGSGVTSSSCRPPTSSASPRPTSARPSSGRPRGSSTAGYGGRASSTPCSASGPAGRATATWPSAPRGGSARRGCASPGRGARSRPASGRGPPTATRSGPPRPPPATGPSTSGGSAPAGRPSSAPRRGSAASWPSARTDSWCGPPGCSGGRCARGGTGDPQAAEGSLKLLRRPGGTADEAAEARRRSSVPVIRHAPARHPRPPGPPGRRWIGPSGPRGPRRGAGWGRPPAYLLRQPPVGRTRHRGGGLAAQAAGRGGSRSPGLG
jgi:hypothetical protein